MKRRLKVTALVKKWGQFVASARGPRPGRVDASARSILRPYRRQTSPLLAPKPTDEQLAKARAAMQEIVGDGSLLGRWHG